MNKWGLAEYPKYLGYVWEWFTKLANTRQVGMSANPIQYQEILAFCQLKNIRMSPFEVDLIIRLDQISRTPREGKK